ncbi:hypothetical protein SHELI_v1c09130 [Spiroplasma helicoides]|uniref:Uncharacterized protein n=1 Tax=Spiroplasma helicoides TaxID=216938 RepID=A0A1B3SLP8_9MOLU|nr:hypothetical protein [Spiroplasma helicoides]AOG60862.1 hypothetical protein SHELI_v1c09130 [Spiroplasma helicoides]
MILLIGSSGVTNYVFIFLSCAIAFFICNVMYVYSKNLGTKNLKNVKNFFENLIDLDSLECVNKYGVKKVLKITSICTFTGLLLAVLINLYTVITTTDTTLFWISLIVLVVSCFVMIVYYLFLNIQTFLNFRKSTSISEEEAESYFNSLKQLYGSQYTKIDIMMPFTNNKAVILVNKVQEKYSSTLAKIKKPDIYSKAFNEFKSYLNINYYHFTKLFPMFGVYGVKLNNIESSMDDYKLALITNFLSYIYKPQKLSTS